MSDRDIIGYLSNEPTITGQMEARFPASVYATFPIKLDRSGANYTFSFDMNAVLEAVNFGGFVLGPASAIDGHFPLFDGATGKRIKDGKAAPSGEVVGTTDAQTLTNKTLTSPQITTPTGIVKGDVGLGNVDNTSDADKPVSTAQQNALDLKADKATTLTAGTGLTGGGDWSANRSIALDSASIASLGKADTAVQPARTISAGTGLAGGGDLSANRTIALSAGSIASLGKADTAVQPGALATVATTGAYSDLSGKPTLATVATTGAYADLTGKPYTVPVGGTTGQVLAKNSSTDGDTKWVTGGGGGGSGDVVGPATNSDSYIPQWDGANSKTLKNGLAVGTGANNIPQLDGNGKLLNAVMGASSIGASGYYTLPGGLIVQWGITPTPVSGASSTTFPIAFPNACASVMLTINGFSSGTSGLAVAMVASMTTTGFTSTHRFSNGAVSDSSSVAKYIAIGY